jgi:hypothetical protein
MDDKDVSSSASFDEEFELHRIVDRFGTLVAGRIERG